MKTILVTGATGFMASHIIPKLEADGYTVIGIDNRIPEDRKFSFPLLKCDILDFKSLINIPTTDYVLHLAAIAAPNQCRDNPSLAYDVNVLGTNNILNWARTLGTKKVVFLSSAHVYGISPKFMPTPEDAPLQLNDTYTTTKLLGEYLCQLYYSNYSLPYLAFRLFNSYGPYQTPDYFIPAMIKKAKAGEIELTGANVTKDFVYIDDVVDAILRGLRTDYVGELNIGTGVQTSLGTVAEKIAKYYGAKFSIAPKQPSATYMQADINRIRSILGWTPPTKFEEGLAKTVGWYQTKDDLNTMLKPSDSTSA